MQETGIQLPEHAFYEDNFYVYGNLEKVKTLYYMDLRHRVLRYTIGRAGQSVQGKRHACRRYAHQLQRYGALLLRRSIWTLIISRTVQEGLSQARDVYDARHRRAVTARMNGTTQAERDLEAMWENCRKYDEKWAKAFPKKSGLMLMSIPGKGGARCGPFTGRPIWW